MTPQQRAQALIADPVRLGAALGYDGFRYGLHDRWIRRMVSGTEDMTLQAHRGSYKTTCLCVAIALMMIRYRDKNIIFLRKTDDDVTEVVKNVERILASDIIQDIYRALTGGKLDIVKSNSSEITTSVYCAPRGAAQLLGIGIGASLTGKHADIVITDDIVNLKDRLSAADREKTKAIYMELQNVRNPGGRFINTGTPWHKEDAFTLMPPPERYDCYQTGMLDSEALEGLRRKMTASLFAANYELQHIAAENALFATSPGRTDDIARLYDGIAHVDAAYGGEDGTAFTCGCRRGDTLYLYGKLWHKHVDTVMDVIASASGFAVSRCTARPTAIRASSGGRSARRASSPGCMPSVKTSTSRFQRSSESGGGTLFLSMAPTRSTSIRSWTIPRMPPTTMPPTAQPVSAAY